MIRSPERTGAKALLAMAQAYPRGCRYLEHIELQQQEVGSEVVDSSADSVGFSVHPERPQKQQESPKWSVSPSFSWQSGLLPRFPRAPGPPVCCREGVLSAVELISGKPCSDLGGVGENLDGELRRQDQNPACSLRSWTWCVGERGSRKTGEFC